MSDEVVVWRRTLLLAAGFADALADQIARDSRYDLHGLLDLIDKGCPPHLAARILAPVVSERSVLRRCANQLRDYAITGTATTDGRRGT